MTPFLPEVSRGRFSWHLFCRNGLTLSRIPILHWKQNRNHQTARITINWDKRYNLKDRRGGVQVAVVEGRIDARDAEATFRATADCVNNEPTGSIFGCLEAEINDRDFRYVFKADRASRVVTTTGTTRSVTAVYRNATVTNITSRFSVFNATITLEARRSSSGVINATLTIRRPGRVTLRASGRLRNGVIIVNRAVSCIE
jgi:hypothetical protein